MFIGVIGCAVPALSQSVPAGQVTHQIDAIQTQKTEVFKNALDSQINLTGLVDAQADVISNSTDKTGTISQASIAAAAAANVVSADKDTVDKAISAAQDTAKKAKLPHCSQNSDKSYSFDTVLPLRRCSPDAIQSFFTVSGAISIASNVQYLYNPKQSTNQLSADLFTATFPQGFQAVLAATATSGSSQPSTTAQTSTQTDSVSTAVSKLQQGGDFNIRFPVPLLYRVTDRYGIYGLTSPALGFNVSGLSGQNTITESTEYNVNVPLELYLQSGSIEKENGVSSAILYFDLKPSVEVVSGPFATAIGLKSKRYFFLGQADAGIEFSGSVRAGFQYFYGPMQVYQSSGTTTSTHLGGVHVVVSFTPKAKS